MCFTINGKHKDTKKNMILMILIWMVDIKILKINMILMGLI